MKSNLRITSGIFRGRKIISDLPEDVRPTPERQRQAVFNMLQNNLEGKTFLDLFSGSGINGFEALSRGAAYVEFVDKNRKLTDSIQKNISEIRIPSQTAGVVCSPAEKYLGNFRSKGFDYIYLDPPFYKEDEPVTENIYNTCGSLILKNRFLNEGGILITEFFKKNPVDLNHESFCAVKQKIYGTIGISFWKLKNNN